MTAPTAPVVTAPVVETVAAPVESASETFGKKLDSLISKAPIPNDDGSAPAIAAGGVSGPERTQTPETVTPSADGAVAEVVAPVGPQDTVKVDDADAEMSMGAERNPDGTFKAKIDPEQKFDITIRDKQTGETKTYSKNVPELLRLAKDGIAVQKSRDELNYYRNNVNQWQESHQTLTTTTSQLRAELDAQMQLNRELLTAPDDIVIARRNEFAQEMSPEKRLARLEAELKQKETHQQQTVAEQARAKQVTDFANSRLAPHLAAAEAKIGPELVKMKLALDLVPFQVNGRVPPERLQALEAHLSGPFTQWVTAKAAELSAPNPAVKAAEAAALKAQQEAQRAVNTTGRQIAPVGVVGAGAGADPAKPQAPPKNIHEAIDRIINKPVAA